ncbi:MAG TPA: CDP-alcohol phosphatidyltransferase family protein [Candidatus Dormibacteraeota bacterium]|nr:CDP-alcohol phosphatidyltransferase family protein [Candidatus Dormibacteraeota bacterium]
MQKRRLVRASTWLPDAVVRLVARTGIHPNFLSALGLVVSLSAAASLGSGRFATAGVAMLGAGMMDWLDGSVARVQGRASRFGEFLDSSFDCYSDLILFVGLLVYYARVNRFLYAVLVCVAMAGSVMVGYSRARSASLVAHGDRGPLAGLDRCFWERPERIGLMILGAVTNRMAPVLWILAIGPNVGVVGTILRARRKIHLMTEQESAHPSTAQAIRSR